MGKARRVVLLDDHPIVRQGLEVQLLNAAGIVVVGSYATAPEMIRGLDLLWPKIDAVIVDFMLGPQDVDGLKLLNSMRVRFPKLPVVVFSSHCNPSAVLMMLQAGVRGFVAKSGEVRSLADAVNAVSVRREYIDPVVAQQLAELNAHRPNCIKHAVEKRDDLTMREHEVIRCVLDGMTTSEIATKFSRAPSTVSTQKKAAYIKLGVRSDPELFKLRHLFDAN